MTAAVGRGDGSGARGVAGCRADIGTPKSSSGSPLDFTDDLFFFFLFRSSAAPSIRAPTNATATTAAPTAIAAMIPGFSPPLPDCPSRASELWLLSGHSSLPEGM